MKKQNRKLAQGAKLLLAGVALAAVASTSLMAGAASLGSSPFAVKAVYSSDTKFWAIKPFLKTSGTTEPGSGSTTTPPTTTPTTPTDPNPRTVAMTIDTSLPGCVPSQFNLQVWGDMDFFPDAQINWGDGTTSEVKNGDTYSHSYTGSKTYDLTIDGRLKGLYRNVGEDVGGAQNCIKSVDHIGSDTGMTLLTGFLYKASNVTSMAPPPATVTTLKDLLLDATSFNGKVSDWNVSNVTDFTGTFMGATSFNQPIDSWNMSKATTLGDMFMGATKFNQPVNSWDTAKVTNMSGVFSGTAFNQPLTNWKTSKVTNTTLMFSDAPNFNQDISDWDMAQVTNFASMFRNASSFDQPIGKWITAKALDVGSMLSGATSFKQNLSNWDFSAIPDISKRNFAYHSSMTEAQLPKGLNAQDALYGVN